jgi:septum formation protein
MNFHIVLASSSKYRQELLSRLHFKFEVQAADINEDPLPKETPLETCQRLAKQKALHIASNYPSAIVIGCDQVVDIHGTAVSKPGSHELAKKQLQSLQGQSVTFHSAVCIVHQTTQQCIEFNVPTLVTFRTLNDDEIERYLNIEQPYDCAGSAKSEGLGISLLERLESTDPTALIGLPLIELSKALRTLGIVLP